MDPYLIYCAVGGAVLASGVWLILIHSNGWFAQLEQIRLRVAEEAKVAAAAREAARQAAKEEADRQAEIELALQEEEARVAAALQLERERRYAEQRELQRQYDQEQAALRARRQAEQEPRDVFCSRIECGWRGTRQTVTATIKPCPRCDSPVSLSRLPAVGGAGKEAEAEAENQRMLDM